MVILYSAVPYALPVCNITSDAEEVQLMVKYGWIGTFGSTNKSLPTAKQLFENGQYIIEEPTIYVITKSITKPAINKHGRHNTWDKQHSTKVHNRVYLVPITYELPSYLLK
ncbi:hypothetical protein JCM16161A_16830 [Vulcanisaeta sp. JCM 16161]|uniref:hypothetical protein n=1 Tax=Vulcanisaeta sp. JCM 16161 TaxID=1295372 RepID=UPI0006D099E3|nr:hypothetical protein [Vulcanisaeta sp. JCM 16161]